LSFLPAKSDMMMLSVPGSLMIDVFIRQNFSYVVSAGVFVLRLCVCVCARGCMFRGGGQLYACGTCVRPGSQTLR
jgi:hypothetical protein